MKNTKKKIMDYEYLENGLHQFIDSDDIYWYNASKAAALIGFKNTADAIQRYVSKENKFLFKRSQFENKVLICYKVNNAGEILINKKGLFQLLMYCNVISSSQKNEFAIKFNLKEEIDGDFHTQEGHNFISNLKEILSHLGIKSEKEYKIFHEYRIDLYIPEYKLAIEYDDKSHNLKSTAANDRLREFTLKEILGCDFIRLSYKDSSNKNIAKVINKIFSMENTSLRAVEGWMD